MQIDTRFPLVEFERKRATEGADVREIVRGILLAQAKFAAAQHRPLARGTHAKGVCARAVFEVFDLTHTIGDPTLVPRLGRGLFARPGTYPAVVRFANASSQIQSDRSRDVRALSFSVEVAPGVFGDGVDRLDFSLNDAPIFPINDAHAFAVLVRILNAGGRLASLKALWTSSLRDLAGLGRTALLGALQTKKRVQPYQTLRYWSNVPFRHGGDEAIKYSALPSADNPAQPLGDGPECLRDELVRHLRNDTRMSAFDFALQLFEPERMTRWGLKRDPTYWIENASVEWKEAQAPFYTVGRLTLVAGSELSEQETRGTYIDVTEHSTPDGRPLGSINRARWAAEAASREARLHGVTAMPAPVPVRLTPFAIAGRAAVLALAALFLVSLGVRWWYNAGAAANLPPAEQVSDVRFLDQGWGTAGDSPARQLYYYTAQGASMHGIRYSWFINIERPFRTGRFADPEHMRQLRFIVDETPSRANPDHLPVGFTRRFDDTLQDTVVDITCAACHTGQLNAVKGGRVVAIRVDGGQGMSAFTDVTRGSFQAELASAFATTLANPIKFNRFARRVLGPQSAWSARARLWGSVFGVFTNIIKVGRGSSSPHWYPTQEGFGRTDALARIGNVVFGDHISAANYHTGNAPVSFPYLWNIWKFDWVQYNASVSQPMARNVGETLGTGASYNLVDAYGQAIPAADRYRTSIAFENLQWIETTLQDLQPPTWPTDLLGPIDQAKVSQGRALFDQHCAGCHGPHLASPAMTKAVAPLRGPGDPMWEIHWKALPDVGTDPNAAMNFVTNRVDLTRTGIEMGDVARLLGGELAKKQTRDETLIATLKQQLAARTQARAPQAELDDLNEQIEYANQDYQATRQSIASMGQLDLRSVSVGEGLTVLGMIIRDRYYTDRHFSPEARACFEGFDTLDLPQAVPGYKPRPLKGVWATPPFLHNGSVPTLYALLSPEEERPARFYVGTRQFDPKNVGYVTEPPSPSAGGFWFDTTLPGNRNTGHQFRKGYVPFDDSKPAAAQYQNGVIGPELTRDQRLAIVEYLKVGPDEPAPAVPHVAADCFALIGASATAQGSR